MPNNPFTYGNPIEDPACFIGRDGPLSQILSRLHNPAFESSSVVGDRRIGKTSLLNAMAAKLKAEARSGICCVLSLDPQMLSAQATPKRFWERMLYQLSRLPLSNFLRTHVDELRQTETFDTFDLSDLFDELNDAGISVVLLLDEFERVAQNENFGPDFFYGLRSLAIHHRLALITASYAELSTISHSPEVRSSPFFNIFATIHLGVFGPEEVDEFFVRYLAGTDIRFLESERASLRAIAGTHPYYLQVAGHFLFDAYQQGLPKEQRLTYTLRRFAAEAEDTLAHTWRYATDEEKISLTVLALLSAPQEDKAAHRFNTRQLSAYYAHAAPTLARMARRGVVVEQGDDYALFSTVLGAWIRNELRAVMMEPQTYTEWVNDPANQGRLAKLRAEVADDVKENVLPKLKEQYRELVVSWLTNPATAQTAFNLLRGWLGK